MAEIPVPTFWKKFITDPTWADRQPKTKEEIFSQGFPEMLIPADQRDYKTEEELWGAHAVISSEYVTIWVPSLSDVFRLPSLWQWLGENEEKRRKAFFAHLKTQPVPEFAKKMQRIAKLTDDIEDYMSTLEVAGYWAWKATSRFMPAIANKIGGKIIPGIGWYMTAMDLLNLGTAAFSFSSIPLSAKRFMEGGRHLHPNAIKARLKNPENIKKWKPHLGSYLEVAQASEDLFGVGIRLGALFGFLSDCFWGTAQYVAGNVDQIKMLYPWERQGTMEYKAIKCLNSYCELGPVMKYLPAMNFYAYAAAIGLGAGHVVHKSPHPKWLDVYLEMEEWDLVYDPPTKTLTRKILEDEGYDPDENVGYIGLPWGQMPKVKDIGMVYQGSFGSDLIAKYYEGSNSWTSYLASCGNGNFEDDIIPMLAWAS